MAALDDPLISGMMECRHCGTSVYVPPYRRTTFRCCSHKCLSKYLQTKRSVSRCHQCSKEFEVGHYHTKTAKYCSRACYQAAMKGRGHVEFECEWCSKIFRGSPSRVGKKKFCSSECYGASKRRMDAPGAKYRKWAFENYPHECERCGYNEVPGILVVHHRDRDRTNHKLENLQILCPTCHEAEHYLYGDGRFQRGKNQKVARATLTQTEGPTHK